MKGPEVLGLMTILLNCPIQVLSEKRLTREVSNEAFEFLSLKVLKLETTLFQEQRKTSELERRIEKLGEVITSLSEGNPSLKQDSLQNSALSKTIDIKIDHLKTGLGQEKLQRKRLEENVQEIKENLSKREVNKDIKQLRNITKSLTNRISVIEQKSANVSCNSSGTESNPQEDRVVKPNRKIITKTVGVQFDGKALNEDDNKKYSDCRDLYDAGYRKEGVYNIYLSDSTAIPVRCNSHGYMLVQKRINGKENFNRTWEEYKMGFGNLQSEFWIGNEFLWQFLNRSTVQKDLYINIYFVDYVKVSAFLLSKGLNMQSESGSYRLSWDSTAFSPEMQFQRPVKGNFMTWDNQLERSTCPPVDGGWWYHTEFNMCKNRQTNPNSQYKPLFISKDYGEVNSYHNFYHRKINGADWPRRMHVSGSEVWIIPHFKYLK